MVTGTDQDKDVVEILAAVIRDAHQQADMVGAFLESVRFLPPETERDDKPRHLPPDFLLKLGALTKLYRLANADLKDHLPDDLPCWEDVYADLVAEARGKEVHFSGQQLSSDLLKVLFERLCWQPIENNGSAVVISQTLDPDTFLDELAQMLWNYRHLGHDIQEDDNECTNKE